MIDWHMSPTTQESNVTSRSLYHVCFPRQHTYWGIQKSNQTPLAPPERHTKITMWVVRPHWVYLTAAGAAFLLSASHTWADRTMWLNPKINTSEVTYCVSIKYSLLSEVTRLINAVFHYNPSLIYNCFALR